MKELLIILLVICNFKADSQSKGFYYNLDDAVKNSGKVKNLILNSKNIEKLPIEVTEMKNLRIINLSFNERLNLVDLFVKLSKVNGLKELDISFCSIVELPKEVKLLQNLKVLEIGGNNFKSIPEEIGQLRNLKELVFTQGAECFYLLSLQEKRKLVSLLPKCKILLRQNRSVHGKYLLGKRTVRVTMHNVDQFSKRPSYQ